MALSHSLPFHKIEIKAPTRASNLLSDAYHSTYQPTMNVSSPPWNEIYGMKITENELFNYENKQGCRMGWEKKEEQSTQNLYLIKIFTGLCFALLFLN